MKKSLKILLRIILTILIFIILFGFISFLRHKISLKNEKSILNPIGNQIDIDGHKLHIYQEGSGNHTLVFLSGSGTCSPFLDFKSLYSLLSSDYKIVVVEKFGYGFSDDFKCNRDIDIVLNQTRTALEKADISGPYILCPHSMSGIEALYWAQKYPDEVESIIGLDMAVPAHYDQMKINLPLIKIAHFAAKIGITRWIPGISESDAIKHGTLTENEKRLYKFIFYNRTATVSMVNEAKEIKRNAQIVKSKDIPQIPMLLFISNGSGGTGFDENTWRNIPKFYFQNTKDVQFINLDCPHYVHDYEYIRINKEIRKFLEK